MKRLAHNTASVEILATFVKLCLFSFGSSLLLDIWRTEKLVQGERSVD